MALFALLVVSSASATVLADWDLEELCRRSDLVVVGTVVEQRTLVDEAKKAVVTESVVTVERTLLGREAPTVVLTQLGGRLGSVISEVVGDARIHKGDRVLLFTFAHEDGRRYLVGMALGVWFLVGKDGTLEQTIESPVFSPSTGQLSPAPGRRTITLDDVKGAVEKVAKAGPPELSKVLEELTP